MIELAQELMTPDEAAKWFRRSPSWLRQQTGLLRVKAHAGQPLFHVRVCRAYVLGQLAGLAGDDLRRVQIRALASACGVSLPIVVEQPPCTPGATPDAAAVQPQPVPAASAAANEIVPS